MPRSLQPTPDIFSIPAKCPAELASVLRSALALFWSDPAAAASRVRVTLESLMNFLGVKKRQKNKSGGYSGLNLHQRIEEFEKREPKIALKLMALKLVGNTASHAGSVKKDDLLNAFDILEFALSEIFEARAS